MENAIKSASVALAVMIFFIMAIAGWINNLSPATCAYRAVVGAVIVHTIVTVTGRIIVRILVDEMIESKVKKLTTKEGAR